MKNLYLIFVFAILFVSCNKLTDKNIRGNWEVKKQTINGEDVTPNFFTVWAFNDNGECTYTLEGLVLPEDQTYSLDEKGQVLTINKFITRVIDSTQTSGTIFYEYISSGNFNIEKKGKTVILTNDSITCELEQVFLD